MQWQLWRKLQHNGIPDEVRKTLVEQFHVDPQAVSKMGYLTRSGNFAGRPVRLLRLFDQGSVINTAKGMHRYEDLTNYKVPSSSKGIWKKMGTLF